MSRRVYSAERASRGARPGSIRAWLLPRGSRRGGARASRVNTLLDAWGQR